MIYNLVLQTAPVAEPVTLDEAKSQLRILHSDEDDLLNRFIVAARNYVEAITGRALITQTWDLTLDDFPARESGLIELPKAPLQSVTSVTYTDTAGDPQTWDAGEYVVSTASRVGKIYPAYGYQWPSTQAQREAVAVRFVAGYGDDVDDVPDDIRHAILMLIGHYDRFREAITDLNTIDVPYGVRALLAPHKIHDFS